MATLDEAINQQIELGEMDPLTIARKIEKLHGEEWLAAQLAAQAESLVAEIARKRLGSVRRSAEIALRPGDEISQSDMKIAKVWVPEHGWKRAADLTRDDLLAKAAWYDKLVGAAAARAEWCREVAGMVAAEGVKKLGQLKQPLPQLPDGRELGAA